MMTSFRTFRSEDKVYSKKDVDEKDLITLMNEEHYGDGDGDENEGN